MNVAGLTPFLIVSGAGVLAILLGLLPNPHRRVLPTATAVVGILAAVVVSILQWGDDQTALTGNYVADRFTHLLNFVFLGALLATLALAWREPSGAGKRGEYAGLLMLSASGMMLVAGAGTMIVLFLGIELLSVSLYVLCSIETWRTRSLEAGLKYLIIGAIGSAILVYGLALLYGATGTTVLSDVQARLTESGMLTDPLTIAALAMVVVGLGFKASAVPMHMWAPDVYEGAPTPITAFMATATKAAALAGFVRVFSDSVLGLIDSWQMAVAIVAAATVIVGNVAAILQDNMKRMLASSGVAQAGYLLIGIAAGTVAGIEAVIYYLMVYVAMTLAAFAIVIMREREVPDGDEIQALVGYGRRRPIAGIIMTLSMLSLAGIPPMAGFVGKFMLFGAAVDADMVWLAVVGAVGSMISLAYYLRVIGVTWFTDPATDGSEGRRSPGAVWSVTIVSGVLIIGLAIGASPLIDLCRDAARAVIG